MSRCSDCPQAMHVHCTSLNSFLCSPMPQSPITKNGADGVRAEVGQALEPSCQSAAPALMSLRAELQLSQPQ